MALSRNCAYRRKGEITYPICVPRIIVICSNSEFWREEPGTPESKTVHPEITGYMRPPGVESKTLRVRSSGKQKGSCDNDSGRYQSRLENSTQPCASKHQ